MPIFSILEVGFGMGIGFFAIDDFLKMYLAKKEGLKNREISLHFLSFEIDYGMLKHVIDLNINKTNILPNLNTWKINKNEDGVIDRLEITKDIIIDITKNIVLHFSGVILIGDGRAVLRPHCQKFSTPPFHAIFQDAFSPRKNPDLWTVEWFDLLKVLSGKEVILSTYSSSTSIRKSLLKAQWNLYNQKGYGHKKAMTKATLNEDILGEKDQELLNKLALSQSSPIYDRDTFDFLDKRSQHKLNNK